MQYTPAIDIWSIGCIFTELLTGRPLIPEKNVVHQLDLITDLGRPSSETLSWIQNEKSKRYLSCMWKNNLSPLLRSFQMLILKIDIEPKRLWLIRTLQVLLMRNVSPQDIQFQNSSLNWTNGS